MKIVVMKLPKFLAGITKKILVGLKEYEEAKKINCSPFKENSKFIETVIC